MAVHLNYFTAGVCVKIIDSKPYVMIVHYYDKSEHKNVKEIRIPGGTVSMSDIHSAISKNADNLKINKDHADWLLSQISTADEKFKEYQNHIRIENDRDRKILRSVFGSLLESVEEAIDSFMLSEDQEKKILLLCQKETLKRELELEIACTSFVDMIPVGYLKRKDGHIQYPFLVLGSDAPDSYEGSSDSDIKKSNYLPLWEVQNLLYLNHRPFLHNAMKEWKKILLYHDHPKEVMDEIDAHLNLN
jgi:hypothetical protein